MEFSENLKQLLKDRNMNQARLCEITGISSSLISNYTTGKKSPAIPNAVLIADAFDVSLDTLAGRKERVRYPDLLEIRNAGQPVGYTNQLNECMDGLTENESTFVLDMIQVMKKNFGVKEKQ